MDDDRQDRRNPAIDEADPDYAPGGYVAADVLVGLIENGARLGESESAVTDVEWSGGYDTNSHAANVLLLENGERYRVTVEYVAACDCPEDCPCETVDGECH